MIRRILFAVPTSAANDPEIAGLIVEIFSELPPHTAIIAIVQSASAKKVTAWLKQCGRNFQIVNAPDDIDFTWWAQDPFAAVKLDSDIYLQEPMLFERKSDGLFGTWIQEQQTGVKRSKAPLLFQGGNILVGDDFMMMGVDYALTWAHRQRTTPMLVNSSHLSTRRLLERAITSYLGNNRPIFIGTEKPVPIYVSRSAIFNNQSGWREYVYNGNRAHTAQPIFHIDMFISLAGRKDGRYRVLVGDPKMAFDLGAIDQDALDRSMPELFDDVATQLSAQGFEVHRNPLPLIFADDVPSKTRLWFFATSNNALVEWNGRDGTVWLPTYAHPPFSRLLPTDDANATIWSDLGFEVRKLGNYYPLARQLGAVHCLIKYLDRSSLEQSHDA